MAMITYGEAHPVGGSVGGTMHMARETRPITYDGHARWPAGGRRAYDERAKDLPRSRDEDPVEPGTADPATSRGLLHAHISSCIDDPDDRLMGHQLVEALCASYGGGAGEDDDPSSAFSERNIRVGEMDPSQGPNKERDPQRQTPGGLGAGRDNGSNAQREVMGTGRNALDANLGDAAAADRWVDDFFARASRQKVAEKPLAADASIEARIKRIVDGIVDPQKRAAEAKAASARAHDQAFDEWRATAERHSRGDTAYHQLAADSARGSTRPAKSGSETLADILAEAGPPPEQV
jgi:hypothetical protein